MYRIMRITCRRHCRRSDAIGKGPRRPTGATGEAAYFSDKVNANPRVDFDLPEGCEIVRPLHDVRSPAEGRHCDRRGLGHRRRDCAALRAPGAELVALDLDADKATAHHRGAPEGRRTRQPRCNVTCRTPRRRAVFALVQSRHSRDRHSREQRRHRPRRHDRTDDAGRSRARCIGSTSQGVFLCARAVDPADASPGRRRDPQHGVDCLAHRHPDRFAYSMTKGRGALDDAVDRRRLHEARHPLQLHLPRTNPHAVCRWLSGRQLSGARAGDAAGPLRVSADRPHGHARGSRAAGALPLLGRVRRS